MRRVGAVTTGRRRGIGLAGTALVALCVLIIGLSGCGNSQAAPQAQTLSEKGTPYADLLIPELATSVTDGAVGVSVESPVTVTATAGVLDSVSLVNEDGREVAGTVSPDGVSWQSAEPLGYTANTRCRPRRAGSGAPSALGQLLKRTHRRIRRCPT